ncbi:MAG: tRNA (adenosine(37)-N6)-dimethylallyltransferase MiaA [Gammaproteobacteria bacterium]
MAELIKPPAVFLMGPTASGKSALAVKIARRLDAEIISVDSALVYRGMDIGTAKPSVEERGGVPHHLIDILDPAQSFSTAQFMASAQELMADITRRGKLPLLVGGTMLYFNALFHGLSQLPGADPGIRRELDRQAAQCGWEALHERLAAVDPQAAERIHRNDPQRIQRALEVYMLSGKPISAFFQQRQVADLPYRNIKIIVAPAQRRQLHETIALRFQQMLAHGLVKEVTALFERGDLNSAMPSVRAVGYRQIWGYLHGDYDYATMTEKAVAATRQLAKRQFTWLRRETNAAIFQSGDTALLDNVLQYIAEPF